MKPGLDDTVEPTELLQHPELGRLQLIYNHKLPDTKDYRNSSTHMASKF